MLECSGMHFSSSIGVLFTLKEQLNFDTLQESYLFLERDDLDSVLKVLRASYNWNKAARLDEEAFVQLLAEKNIGALKLIEIYASVVQAILTDGLTAEEIEERKNAAGELR